MITISAFKWVPPFARGLVRDLRVRWALEEAGLAYQARLIDANDQASADYRARQPFGQVPVFETEIAQHVSYKEAAETGRSILEYQKNGVAADTYRLLAREVALAAGDTSVAAFEPERGGLLAGAGRFFRGLLKSRGHAQPEPGRTLAGAA